MTGGHSGEDKAVLVIGATGALGPAVIRNLLAEGWRVRTLSRTPPLAETLAARVPHVSADVADRQALEHAMAGVEVVVHMAALLHVVNPPPSLQAEYERVNVQGTASVMSAARACAVPRVVALSSICVYGAQAGLLDEDTIPAPETPYAISKLDAEKHVLGSVSPDERALGVVLRLGAVYGPSVKGNYHRLVRALARRRFVPVGSGTNRRTIVFEEDVGRAIVLAASHPLAAGRIFNVTDGEIHTVAAITAAISRGLGRQPPRLAIPLGFARLTISSVEALFRLAGKAGPVTRAALQKYTEDIAVSGQRIKSELGFEPRWHLLEGWQQTIAEMRGQGRL